MNSNHMLKISIGIIGILFASYIYYYNSNSEMSGQDFIFAREENEDELELYSYDIY